MYKYIYIKKKGQKREESTPYHITSRELTAVPGANSTPRKLRLNIIG